MDDGSKRIRPNYESDEFDVREASFSSHNHWTDLVVSLFGKLIKHSSTSRVLVICTIAGCGFVAWAMNESPWPAFCVCALLVSLCVIGVLLDYFCKNREEVRPNSLGFESEVQGQTRSIERDDGHDSLRGPAKGACPVRSDHRREGERREDHHPSWNG